MLTREIVNFVRFVVCDFPTVRCAALPFAVRHLASQGSGLSTSEPGTEAIQVCVPVCTAPLQNFPDAKLFLFGEELRREERGPMKWHAAWRLVMRGTCADVCAFERS